LRPRPARMGRQGFVNYSQEWRHFSLPGADRAAYDFSITARHNRFCRIPTVRSGP
jgi:hypothetical protein